MSKVNERLVAAMLFMVAVVSGLWSTSVLAQAQKNILLLNSYNAGFPWTKEQTEGIYDAFARDKKNVTIFPEYMDWKNSPTKNNLVLLQELYKEKYAGKHIDLIITTDDAALEFALKYRQELWSDAPVIFSGVHPDAAPGIINGRSNVTGVYEDIDANGTLELVLQLMPQLEQLYVIMDNTETGRITRGPVERAVKNLKPDLTVTYLNTLGYKNIIERLQSPADNSAVLITAYNRDVDGEVLTPELYCKSIGAYSRAPVFILYQLQMGYGAVGGRVLNGRLLGEGAAQIGIRVLNGATTEDIPPVTPKGNVPVVDYQQLVRYSLPVDKIPQNCIVINRPISFFEQNKVSILGILAVFSLLIAYIILLRANIHRRAVAENQLRKSNDELAKLYDQIQVLAYHDPLTGLVNRAGFNERLAAVLGREQKRACGAVMFIDLDNFKVVNDNFGHSYGDKLLVRVANILKMASGNTHFLARMGGDEFVFLLEGIYRKEDLTIFSEKVLHAFTPVIIVEDKNFNISVSIGLTKFPDDGDTAEELLRNADLAMYRAKEQGKNRYAFYDQQLREFTRRKMTMEKSLRQAIHRQELKLWYQPQVDLTTGKLVGLEALIRWFSDEHGILMPADFIKLAEDTGLIIPIGYWVLEQACGFLHVLRQYGYHDIKINVNISAVQLMQGDFVARVQEIVTASGVDPWNIGFEITESVLMESLDMHISKLEKIREIGVAIFLDDFGTGYSSLKYLQHLPIDVVKIDKSFIQDIIEGKDDKALTESIIDLVHRMGLHTIAEGIENAYQYERLRGLHCKVGQGYFFGKPISPEEVDSLMYTSIKMG